MVNTQAHTVDTRVDTGVIQEDTGVIPADTGDIRADTEAEVCTRLQLQDTNNVTNGE